MPVACVSDDEDGVEMAVPERADDFVVDHGSVLVMVLSTPVAFHGSVLVMVLSTAVALDPEAEAEGTTVNVETITVTS